MPRARRTFFSAFRRAVRSLSTLLGVARRKRSSARVYSPTVNAPIAGRYELVQQVGEGPLGAVWRALVHAEAGLVRPVCVRVLREPLDRDRPMLRAWAAVANELALHGGSHVEQIFDFVVDDTGSFVVSEWIEGISAARWLDEHGPLSWTAAAAVAVEVLRGLIGPHACSPPLCHEAISPRTVRVATDGTVKLVRFGVASALAMRGVPHRNLEELRVRQPAPERLEGQPATGGSDVFGVGALLFELVTGRTPFEGPPGRARDSLVRVGEFPDMSILRPDLAAPFVTLIERALRPDPAGRYESASVMLHALTQLLRAEAEPADREALSATVRALQQSRDARPFGLSEQRTMHVELAELVPMASEEAPALEIMSSEIDAASLTSEEAPAVDVTTPDAAPLPLTRRASPLGLSEQRTEVLDGEQLDRLTIPEHVRPRGLVRHKTEQLDADLLDQLIIPESSKRGE